MGSLYFLALFQFIVLYLLSLSALELILNCGVGEHS